MASCAGSYTQLWLTFLTSSAFPSHVTYRAKISKGKKGKDINLAALAGRTKSRPGIAESLRAAARVRTRCNIVHANDRKAAQSGIGDFEGLLTSKQ